MKVDRKDFEKSLVRKGFTRCEDGDHIFFHHKYNGRETSIYTKISHTAKMRDISGDLLTSVRRQLGLEKTAQAVDLLKCPMDGEQYNALLIERGVIRAEKPTRQPGPPTKG